MEKENVTSDVFVNFITTESIPILRKPSKHYKCFGPDKAKPEKGYLLIKMDIDTTYISKMDKKIREKFTKVPNFILFNTKISDGALRTYTVLKSYKIGDNLVFPAISTLAKSRGKAKRSISCHLKELQDKCLISIKKRGYGKSSLYVFIAEENCTSLVQKTALLGGRNLHPKNMESNKTIINNPGKNSGKGYEKLRRTAEKIRSKK